MKVLHVIENLRGGGGNCAMCAAAKYSTRIYGHEHTTIGLVQGGLASQPASLAMAGRAGLRAIPGANDETLRANIKMADVVILYWWESETIKRFQTRHDLPAMRLACWYMPAGDIAPNFIRQADLDFADVNVACGRYTYYDVALFVALPPERKAFVLAGADFEGFYTSHFNGHNDYRVGFVCSRSFTKVYRNYVAMSGAVDVPGVKFILAGGGRHGAVFENEAQGYPGKFEFLGRVAEGDMPAIYGRFDVLGHPVISEGSGLALQEAAYCGIPAVTFPNGGVRYLVIDGYTGLWVQSEREYTAALELLGNDVAFRERLGSNAYSFAHQMFGAANAAPGFEKLLQRMMELPKRERPPRANDFDAHQK